MKSNFTRTMRKIHVRDVRYRIEGNFTQEIMVTCMNGFRDFFSIANTPNPSVSIWPPLIDPTKDIENASFDPIKLY